MAQRRSLVIVAVIVFAVVLGRVAGSQIARYRFLSSKTATHEQREALFEMLQPVALANCRLERFGEPHDGGYLMCGNLLDEIEVGYSYGISGYDKWGCDISSRFGVSVHQYDCFDTTQPACPGGRTVFHAECVGDSTRTDAGRPFDTIANQQAKNGDASTRLALKIDVEGAEWNSFLATPDEALREIDQLVVEFHWIEDRKSLAVVQRLKQFFEVAHIHYNNASCIEGMEPFPTWAYEVLFVSKRLAVVDASRSASRLNSLDAPNIPSLPDCQPTAR
jgi:hypothetical protein